MVTRYQQFEPSPPDELNTVASADGSACACAIASSATAIARRITGPARRRSAGGRRGGAGSTVSWNACGAWPRSTGCAAGHDGSPGPSLYCAVIVKQVDAQTRAKTAINELLRL